MYNYTVSEMEEEERQTANMADRHVSWDEQKL
jgi:hypothetical protein